MLYSIQLCAVLSKSRKLPNIGRSALLQAHSAAEWGSAVDGRGLWARKTSGGCRELPGVAHEVWLGPGAKAAKPTPLKGSPRSVGTRAWHSILHKGVAQHFAQEGVFLKEGHSTGQVGDLEYT